MLGRAGAIAGVNADFFGMTGSHSLAFGPVIADGELMSISAFYNQGDNEFASFFLNENNFPMIRYITPRIWFTVNGIERARVGAVNKVATINTPVIINRNGMLNTGALGTRFPDMRQVVVEDGIITGVWGAQSITVPENGFLVVMNEESALRYHPETWVGLYAAYEVFTDLGVDLSQIQMAIGGGGLILQHGQIVHDTGTAVPGRHPRTALGISGDFSTMILMVVDGRGHSIGATHADMAELMRRYGATDAMHLDGGGSSTMVARGDAPGTHLQVVNRVSDGAQRRIVNAIGVFDNSIPGAISQLVLAPVDRYIPRGGSINLQVYGMDLYRHRIPVNAENVSFSAYTIDAVGDMHPATGTWQGNTYFPDQVGALYIRAQYGSIRTSRTYLVQDIVSLQFLTQPLSIREDVTAPLMVTGITATGATANLSPEAGYVQFTVTPEYLGIVQDHIFIPRQAGAGHITAHLGAVQAHLPIAVGGRSEPVAGFANAGTVFGRSPERVQGTVQREGNAAILDYHFFESDNPQGAHMVFTPPIPIPNNPFALRLQVTGDYSDNWLRGRVTDSNGNSHTITFGVIDFTGIQAMTASLPGVGPYFLEHVYVVTSRQREDFAGRIAIGGLEALHQHVRDVPVPVTPQFEDPVRTEMTAVVPGHAYDFSLGLPGSGALGYSVRSEGQSGGIAAVLQMSAYDGGIFATNRNQWGRFLPDIQAMHPDFVIIRMDVNPLRRIPTDERELFHQALRTLRDAGRMVFIVSNAESSPSFTMRDGIRYIDLGNAGEDSTISFRIIDGQIWYDF